MSRADFNEYLNANTNHQLSSTQVNQGDTSMQVAKAGTNSAEILDSSETGNDNPEDWEFEGWVYVDNKEEGFGFIVAFADKDNFYYIATFYNFNTNDTELGLFAVNGGSQTRISKTTISGNNFANFTLSDGNNPHNNWVLIRLHVWVDSGGDLRVRLLEDADGDGTFQRYNGVDDIVDTDPFRTKGGMGFGGLEAPRWGNGGASFFLDADSSQDFQFKY